MGDFRPFSNNTLTVDSFQVIKIPGTRQNIYSLFTVNITVRRYSIYGINRKKITVKRWQPAAQRFTVNFTGTLFTVYFQ